MNPIIPQIKLELFTPTIAFDFGALKKNERIEVAFQRNEVQLFGVNNFMIGVCPDLPASSLSTGPRIWAIGGTRAMSSIATPSTVAGAPAPTRRRNSFSSAIWKANRLTNAR